MRLLLAEDERSLSRAIVTILEKNNYTADAVYDGVEALEYLETGNYDAVGIRVICSFFDEVYRVAGWLKERPQIQVLQVKDYLAYPKANGYRSYHIILSILEGQGKGIHAEIQLRTMAIDFWASLEHQMKYKHKVRHEALIQDELKRCADEIASVDLSIQTIRDLLAEDFGGETGDKIEK